MAYVAIGDKTVQNYEDILGVDSIFSTLTAGQQLQYINFGQQHCAIISKENNLGFYQVTEDMNT